MHLFIDSTIKKEMWVPVSSNSKVSDDCIRDLGFDICLYENSLVSWSNDKELSSKADIIG